MIREEAIHEDADEEEVNEEEDESVIVESKWLK